MLEIEVASYIVCSSFSTDRGSAADIVITKNGVDGFRTTGIFVELYRTRKVGEDYGERVGGFFNTGCSYCKCIDNPCTKKKVTLNLIADGFPLFANSFTSIS